MDIGIFILLVIVLIIINSVLMYIFKSNTTALFVLKIILGVLLLALVVLIIFKLIVYFKKVDKSEPVLINGSINARGGVKVPGDKLIKSNIGTEFTYSFWIYPSGWDYKYGVPKHVLSRGSDPKNVNENMLFNPGIWFYPETSNLSIRFDTFGKTNSYVRENNTVLNYIEYQGESEDESQPIYSEADMYTDISVDECKDICMRNPECSGISLNKFNDVCHIKSSGDVIRQENNDYESFIKSKSMNPYLNGDQYFNPTHDCDLVEIPIQRWSHVVVTLWNRTTDIYLNGKLVRSCILDNVPKIPHGDPLYVTQNGGFDGQLSHLRYFNRALNADEIYSIFQSGPSLHKTLTDTEIDNLKKKNK